MLHATQGPRCFVWTNGLKGRERPAIGQEALLEHNSEWGLRADWQIVAALQHGNHGASVVFSTLPHSSLPTSPKSVWGLGVLDPKLIRGYFFIQNKGFYEHLNLNATLWAMVRKQCGVSRAHPVLIANCLQRSTSVGTKLLLGGGDGREAHFPIPPPPPPFLVTMPG